MSGSITAFAEQKVNGETGEATPSGITLSGLAAFVDDYVKEYIGQDSVGASVVMVKDGQVVLSKGYGYADVEQQIPVSPDTVMEWGSISKLTVWTAVMQLEEQGKIDLNEDIRKLLPDNFLTKLKYDDPITMLNLMNHNAGFEEYMFDMAYQSPEEVRPLEEGLQLAQPAQLYRPGEVVAYSNYGNSLAAYIVERISGQPYYEYVQQHIFDPLDMKNSIAYSVVEDRPELLEHKAKGYFLEGKGSFTQGSWNYMSMYPNGGNNGTAEDLAKFAMAFMPAAGEQSPLFKKPETLETMLSQSYTSAEGMPGIAHGFWEYPGVHRTLGHGGNTIAFATNLQIVPEDRFAIVIMTNQASESHIVHGLTKAIVGTREQTNIADLPEVSEVQGKFMAARRPGHGFMNLFPYLTLMKLEPQGGDQLRVTLAGMTGNYRQVQPYLYEKVSGDSALDAWPMLYAKVSAGKVEAVSVYTTDYLPLPASKSMPVLLICAGLAVLAVAYFIIAPFVLLVLAILNKRRAGTRRASRKLAAGLTLTGTGIIVNNLVLALRMLSNNERAYAEVYPQIMVNYGLTGLAVVFLAALLISWKKNGSAAIARTKYGIILPAGMMVILVSQLVFWQFYS
ncbi:serine hydrolase domain-containing protein [Paenibacillus sp. MMS20-IR301]|uniref:serine hydrolase domain-containing protein n=1 Tax=Paenibacillus sp. MMS20-IR301 TaxID=2895946 RepID=UPI0028EB9493|nr:serine hydrolase domain-containing protein [Paenibacillus sp. MMS20-IR301]WNS45560.1 serine hydrolase domain-containing protein [Paenibacillus sp. MMS20-IR301]